MYREAQRKRVVNWDGQAVLPGPMHINSVKPCPHWRVETIVADFGDKNDENYALRQPHCRLTPPRGTPANIRIHLIFLETRITGLHFRRWYYGSSIIEIFLVSFVKRFFSATVRFGRSRSSKVIDFGTNQSKARMQLPISPSSFVLSCTVSETLHVVLLMTPPLLHPNFGQTDDILWHNRALCSIAR